MNKTLLTEYLHTMLRKTASDENDAKYWSVHHVLGNEHIRLSAEANPSLSVSFTPPPELGPTFIIVDEGVEALASFVNEVGTDAGIRDKVGTQAIQKSAENLVRAFRDKSDVTDEELKAAIEREIESLRSSPKRWTYQTLIKNLVFVDFDTLAIGKVVFRSASSAREQIVVDLHNKINQDSESGSQRQQIIQHLDRQLDEVYESDDVWAEIGLEIEESRLKQLANSEIDASLNLLRCYTHLLFARDYRIRIGLLGETQYSVRPAVSFNEDSKSLFTNSMQVVGSLQPFYLRSQIIEKLREEYSLDILSQTIAKPDSQRSKLEVAVVTAIRWLGRGVHAIDLPEKVLNFAAASERLLIGDNENHSEIVERYTRRLAFLIGETPEERFGLSKRAKELYNARNKVIHAGKTDVAAGDVQDMEMMTLIALIKMARHLGEWQKHEQFIAWVEAKSYNLL